MKTNKIVSGQFVKLDASKTGVHFNNKLTPNPINNHNVIKSVYFYNGAGVAILDYDNDGLSDVLFTGNQVPNKLYKNKGNFEFEDVTEKANLKANRWANGVTVADVNADGFEDIYICYGGVEDKPHLLKNELYINNGNGTFSEVAEKYGIAGNEFSVQASFFDYDKDGDLDLIVSNHARLWKMTPAEIGKYFSDNPESAKRVTPKLYENLGKDKFRDVTEQSGIVHCSYGLGLVTADFNGDGWTDIYIANDLDPTDYLFINQKNGTFKNMLKVHTNQISWFSMGIDANDVNNDGKMDFSVLDMSPNDHIRSKTLMLPMNPNQWKYLVDNGYQSPYMFNAFQINNGIDFYSNISHLTGMASTDWSWATLLADFDNDGLKDNFITNGYRKYQSDNDFVRLFNTETAKSTFSPEKFTELYEKMPEVPLPNLLFHNKGQFEFDNVAAKWGIDQPSYSNGAAYGDLDNDGDLDLVVNNIDAKAFVYENQISNNNFIRIKLQNRKGKNEVENAKVYVYVENEILHQEFIRTRGFQSAVESTLHFGLGEHKKIDSIRIVWSSLEEQKIIKSEINTLLTITKNDGLPQYAKAQNKFLFSRVPKRYFRHQENEFDDFETEVLLPQKQSTLGPFIAVGDVNNDGLEDFFVGGAKDQSGKLLLQNSQGDFTNSLSQPWEQDKLSEDMGATFFDADGDGDLDLYVVSGGNEFRKNKQPLQDRLYFNKNGTFVKGKLPKIDASGSKVKAYDFDKDGDLDLFIGANAIPGQYPFADKCYLLENQKGQFIDVSSSYLKEISGKRMISDFEFCDINKDGKTDLVLVGNWESIEIFTFEGKDLRLLKTVEHTAGWWNSLLVEDLDKDGSLDIVVGNLGGNNKFHPSKEKPLHIYCNDFDQNGSYDIVLSKEYKSQLVPLRGRQCSSEQMPFISDKFPTYNAFANASLEDIYGDQLDGGIHKKMDNPYSIILWNKGDASFDVEKLPIEAQFAPINSIVCTDIDHDGAKELLIGGNIFNTEVETNAYDAGYGLLLRNKKNRKFESLSMVKSGIFNPLNIKDVKMIRLLNNTAFLFANNNSDIIIYKKN